MLDKRKFYINGQWVEPSKKNDFDVINPSDETVCAVISLGSQEDTNAAVTAARAALPSWANSSKEDRVTLLERLYSIYQRRMDEMAEVISMEMGAPIDFAKRSQAPSGTEAIEDFLIQLRKFEFEKQLDDSDNQLIYEPKGVCALITPWNWPISQVALKVIPAIAAGCTMVLKPSEIAPLDSMIFAEMLEEAGCPAGVFNLVMGSGSEVGETLCTSADIQAVTFTGSVAVGRHIARNAIDNMARVQLEMGSKNALIVLNDADMDTAIQCAVAGAYFGTGQKCTASSRIIVESGIHDEFVAKMTEAMSKLVVGNSMSPGVHIGAVVDERQFNQNLKYMEIAKQEGAQLVQGGERLSLETEGYFMSPALFIGTTNQMQINREEVFGPIACVIKVKSYEEALEASNDSDFGLTSGIITTSLKYAGHFKRHSKSGCVMVNLPTAGTDYHVPFGGRKASSYGPREQGQYARDFYTIIKTNYSKPY